MQTRNISITWDQAPHWGKNEKNTAWVKKEICERSEPSGSLGSRKGGGAWRHACDAAVP